VDGLPSDVYRDLSRPGSAGYWVEDNAPRPPRPEDIRWDRPPPWRVVPTRHLLESTAARHPVAWRNFRKHTARLLPAQLSVSVAGVHPPRTGIQGARFDRIGGSKMTGPPLVSRSSR
jgi:hypothetical protein